MLDDFSQNDLAAIEKMTQELGNSFFGQMALEQPGMLDRRWWEDRIMAWAMRDESVKVQMFRFIDVLPMLTSSESVVRHLHEYFDEVRYFLPSVVRLGMAIASECSVAGRVLAIAARHSARAQARRFIAGTDTREVLATAMRQRKLKRAFTLDVLGEAVTSQLEADRYLNAYVELIQGIAPTVNGWPEVPQIDQGVTGPLPRTNISVKLSALDSQFDPIDPQGTCTRVCGRLRRLLRVAQAHHAFVNIDMESYFAKDLTLRIFKEVFMEEEFHDTPDVGIAVQCYLKDTASDLASLRDWAIERGTPIWVRLVKGAYWDYETIHASAAGWPIPVFLKKSQSDVCFEQQSRFLVLNHQHLRPVLASHNIRSLAAGIAAARHAGLSPGELEFQMLYGMGDEIKQVMTKMGYRIRVYMPYGELIPGMAYLVRRLLENTSNDSFLRASLIQHVSPEILLKNPLDADDSHTEIPKQRASPWITKPFKTNRLPTLTSRKIARQCSELSTR